VGGFTKTSRSDASKSTVPNLAARTSLKSWSRVSVVIPAYNAAATIAKTLDSVFAQTFQNLEVVVVNDGSPDTEELERVLQPYFARITYLRQENRGPAAARNAGILRSSGEYVAVLDSDDTWDPEYLDAQLTLLESQEGADLVYADLRMVGESPRAGKTCMEDCPSRGRANFESILREDCQIPNSAVVVRRRVLMEAGLFDEALRRVEDWDMWLRVAWRGGKILYQQRILGTYLLRSDSLSADVPASLAAAVQVLTKLDRQLELSPAQRTLLRRKKSSLEARANLVRGKSLLLQGEFAQARECMEQAYQLNGGLKVLAAVMCLRVAPGLTRAVAIYWKQSLLAVSQIWLARKKFHHLPWTSFRHRS
jgi:cellulose synthase/poly-beta-1,6-N-acetylglucosamine synthase-like glycosyltransferase